MLSLSLLLISLLAGTSSVASPLSSDYNTFGFEAKGPSPASPGLTLLDASTQGLGFYPSEGGGGGGGGGIPDFAVPLQQQQQPAPQQQQIDYYYSQQQPEFAAEFEIAEAGGGATIHDGLAKAEEPDYASCTKVCCEGHYGEILTFSTGETGFDYVNRCSPRPSTFFYFYFFKGLHIISFIITAPTPPLLPNSTLPLLLPKKKIL